MRDAAQRAHRAGNHDHRIRRIRSTGERSVHAFEPVGFHPSRQAEAGGQFFSNDLLRVTAKHDVDFVRLRIESVEQPLGVQRAAGSSNGDEDFHDGQLNTKRQTPNTKKTPSSKIKRGRVAKGIAVVIWCLELLCDLDFGFWSLNRLESARRIRTI
jgi:hypothetical protein